MIPQGIAIVGFSLSLGMSKRILTSILSAFAVLISLTISAQPTSRVSFNEGWTFTKDGNSRVVDLPHDWGVDGNFDINFPGETGKLPWWGKAEYCKTFRVDERSFASLRMTGRQFFLDIDGAMSWSKVYCNGRLVTEWPYGYASYRADLTPFIKEGDNEIKVTLDNPEESSRWYPGGGIYRNVWLTEADPVGVAHWGTYITTKGDNARLEIRLRNPDSPVSGTVRTDIYEYDGTTVVASAETKIDSIDSTTLVVQEFDLAGAKRWSPEHPNLYKAVTAVFAGDAAELRPYSAAAKRGWTRPGSDGLAAIGDNDRGRYVRKEASHRPEAVAIRRANTPRSYENFRFDPNTVSVDDLMRLGFSQKQAQSIDNYRRKGGRFRRKADFAKSFVVEDSVYKRLERFIDIPKLDINKADSAAFETLPGIGKFFASRMVSYRNELGGYSYPEQLMDIWHFDQDKYNGLKDLIFVGPSVPYPLWSLPERVLARHPYIGKSAAHGIVLFRENTPPAEWTVENMQQAGILDPGLGEKLSRCKIAPPSP